MMTRSMLGTREADTFLWSCDAHRVIVVFDVLVENLGVKDPGAECVAVSGLVVAIVHGNVLQVAVDVVVSEPLLLVSPGPGVVV